ncbi:rna polymerase rpb7-like domain-containing protein [Diplodia corticola]|uniref:DNA-directed RNA polymerase subunit n=1 Tax=Diplodia corticola TaxID=236234 RepID=A0A1J9R2K8_9PEZI|nr:rna polymerase rpb7-like domain-containing protein [Diplodia corticola]OJD34474.1 rna polymerase rpb7-like domain-containing protein [Diplodia corticola]
MSAEAMAATSPVADKKAHKHKKDKSEHKSKKRAREEEQAHQSPAKKPRAAKGADATPQKASKGKTSMFQKPAAAKPMDSDDSPFVHQTASLYLPLASIGQQYPLKALCAEHLSPLLLTYYPPLKGVVLAYNNAKLSEGPAGVSPAGAVLARSVDEYAVSFVWVTADFVVLRPRKGIWIEGSVNLQNESHLGLVCWNLFSASIDRKRLPEDWAWVAAGEGGADDEEEEPEGAGKLYGDQGHFVDAQGKKVDGVIKFRIRDFEASPRTEHDRGFITFEGSLLSADKEKELDEQELEKYAQRSAARKGRSRPRGGASSGARR